MPGEVVRFERLGRVAQITLERPEASNAVDDRVMAGLEAALNRIEGDDGIVCVVVTGAGGRTFCSGGDIPYFHTLDRAGARAMSERMQAILDRLDGGSRVVVAAVDGSVRGGGCEVLTACHLRLCGAAASFQFLQAEMGLTTGWGGGRRLFRELGHTQALRLLVTGERIDAAEALRIGLVHRIVADGSAVEAARALADSIAGRSARSLRGFLELARHSAARDPEIAARETEIFVEGWDGERFLRAREDFLRRKKPG